MPKLIGPTIPRWQLGEELARLRRAAGLTELDVAAQLDCSDSKIKKLEQGQVGVVRAELMVMLDLFGVTDDALRASLLELQRVGKQRGWWSKYGQVSAPFAIFLGLESAAVQIHAFEPLIVHGLLQTEDYARAIAGTTSLTTDPDARERQVTLRMERQQRVFAEDPPQMWVIFDEAVLHRVIGGPEVMAAQLERLLEAMDTVTIQVVPYDHGGYPGTLGAFTIFGYHEKQHSPVVYVEGPAGNLYLERDTDLTRCRLSFDHMMAAAKSPPESRKLIDHARRDFGEQA